MLLLPQFLGAQSKNRTLSGYVTEEGSRELLIGVNVYFPEISKGTTTNRYGFYSITVPLAVTRSSSLMLDISLSQKHPA
jgi:hypothetical protein